MTKKTAEGLLPSQVSGAAHPSVLTEKTTMETIARESSATGNSSPPTEKAKLNSPRENSTNSSEQNLPAVRSAIPYRVWLVQGLVFMERAAFYGSSQPFQNYLQLEPHDAARPGALGFGQARAVLIVYVWFIYIYCTPLAGGLLSDCWLGRRKTISFGFIFYIIGLAILTGTAFSHRIYGAGGTAGFIVGALFIGAGVGMVRPNMTVFIVDQCPEEEPKVVVLKNGTSAVTSRELTIQFIYNVNYWMVNIGGLAGIVTTFTELHAGFGPAYLIGLCLIATAAGLFQAGYTHFTTAPPTGNVLTSVFAALRRRREPGYRKPNQSGDTTPSFIGQDAAVPDEHATILAEAKSALWACLVFLPFPAFMLCIDIMDSGLVAQAGSMQTHGLPNDIMFNLNPISVIVLLPFFQSWLYPFLAKRKINFTPQHRIAVGLLCAAMAMGYSTGIQHLVYITGPCFDRPLKCLSGNVPNEVNIGIQTPTYIFLAAGEILAIVAGTELAYLKAPESMKAIVQAIFQLFSAFGAVLGVAVSFAAEDPNMVYVYASITGLLVVTAIAFEIAIFCKAFD